MSFCPYYSLAECVGNSSSGDEGTITRLTAENEALRARLEAVEAETPDYDAGLLNDYGGGDVMNHDDLMNLARVLSNYASNPLDAPLRHWAQLSFQTAKELERMARLEEALRNVRGHCADVAAAGMLMGSDHTETWNRLREKGNAMLAIVDPALAEAEAARALSQEESDA